MKTLITWLALCGCAFGADERFGFNFRAHYESGSPEQNPVLFPRIVATTPAVYIRDDIGWVDGETSPGVYINGTGVRTSDQAWIDQAHAAGLKVVLILNQYYTPAFYPNPQGWLADSSGTSPAARYAAQVASSEEGKVQVIEVFNEPNNSRTFFGSNWPSNCAAATRLIADAVHADSPDIKVIGLGAQGSDVLAMLGMSSHVDGVVYHPYNDTQIYGADSPESVWEPPYSDYMSWVQAVQKTAPGLPIWETECAQNGGEEQWDSALWVGRRLMMASWLGVQHTFLYQFISADAGQSSMSYHRRNEMNISVINTIYRLLAPDSWNPAHPMQPDSNPISVSSSDPSFLPANFIGLDFLVPNDKPGGSPPTSMVVVWMGRGPTQYILHDDYIPHPIQLTVYHPTAGTILATNIITGQSWHLVAGRHA